MLVTGAAGDIGRAAASRLAQDGWRLALSDHPAAATALNETGRRLADSGVDAWTRTCEVTATDDVAATVTACCDEFGVPAGLFNNAGYQGRIVAVPDYPIDDARKVLEVNVIGVLQVMQYVANAMIAADLGGVIVNSASMAGVGGAPNMAAYSASKAAVIALTRSAAKDLAPHNIRVNAISPAFIGPGRMWDNQVARQAEAGSQYYPDDPDEVAAQMIGTVPLRRYGSTAEVASVVSFLMSSDSSYLTAQNLEINGGSV
ncbi:MAG: SDR family oxidoreductase [Microthrixaceae bacterium]|nr:SDR family oxidoreductase [Microthrixaceae bacterium]